MADDNGAAAVKTWVFETFKAVESLNSAVYAIYFENLSILKFGAVRPSGKDVSSAVQRLMYKGLPQQFLRDGRVIWQMPGGKAEESWLMANFAARGYQPLFESAHLSEWYFCQDKSSAEIKAELSGFYGSYPRAR